MIGSQWNGTVDDGLYCNDSDDTFSDDANYEYGDDDDDDPDATTTTIRMRGDPPIEFVDGVQPPTQEDIDDALDLYGAEPAHEVAFSLMITRAQQARIYAAHAARAPESTPESTPEP